MMIYNTTFLDNSTTFVGVADGVNSMSGGLYAVLILLIVYVVGFAVMKKYDAEVSLVVASFINAILGLFMYTKQWIGIEILSPIFVLLFIFIFVIIIKK